MSTDFTGPRRPSKVGAHCLGPVRAVSSQSLAFPASAFLGSGVRRPDVPIGFDDSRDDRPRFHECNRSTIAYLVDNQPDWRLYLVAAAFSPVFVLVFSIYLIKTRHQASEPGPLTRVPAGLSRRALAATVIVTVIVVWLESFVSSHLLVWRYVSGGERVPRPQLR